MIKHFDSDINSGTCPESGSASVVSHNIQRVIAQLGMNYHEVVAATGLDGRTIRSLVSGSQTPQSRTLRRLADGLGVSTDDFFRPVAGISSESFDAATNPAIIEAKKLCPELFHDWSTDDFSELSSLFGVGGQLTTDGVVHAAEEINKRRVTLARAETVLKTSHSRLLTELVNLLYDRASTTN